MNVLDPRTVTARQAGLLARINRRWDDLEWLPLVGPEIGTARGLLRRGLIEMEQDGVDKYTGAPQWRARPAIEV